MNDLERDIITIIDNSVVSSFEENASKILKIPKRRIKTIVNSLIKNGLVCIIELGDKKLYSQTPLVKKEMINQDLHYKYGARPLSTYS